MKKNYIFELIFQIYFLNGFLTVFYLKDIINTS